MQMNVKPWFHNFIFLFIVPIEKRDQMPIKLPWIRFHRVMPGSGDDFQFSSWDITHKPLSSAQINGTVLFTPYDKNRKVI
jgi:hypothetical protein